MRAALAILLAVAGCDKVLGLTPIEVGADAAPGFAVTGRLRQMYPANDPLGTPHVATSIPPAPGFAVTLDDGAMPSVDYHADGTFSFPIERAGQPYRIAVSGGDLAGDYELATPTLDLVRYTASRPAELREPVRLSTAVHFQLGGGPALQGTPWVASSGIGTLAATAATTNDFTIDWRSQPAFAGTPVGLLDATDYHDLIYVLDMVKGSYTSIAQMFTASIDLPDGIPAMVPGQLVAAPQTACVHLVTRSQELYQQIATIYGTSAGTAAWVIAAVPRAELPPVATYSLAFAQTANPMANLDTDIAFSRGPFTDYPLVAMLAVYTPRNLLLPNDSVPLTAYIGEQLVISVPSASDCKLASASLTSPITAMPNEPLVAGVAIAADATPVPAPTTSFEVRWGYAVSGFADDTTVELYELRSVGGTTTPYLVDTTTVVANSVTFPASDLISGHRYTVKIRTSSGLPSAIAGDFATASYPAANFDVWSHWFQVQ